MKIRIWLALAYVVLASCARTPDAAETTGSTTATTTTDVTATPAGDPVEGHRVAARVGCTGCHDKDGRGGVYDIATPEGDRFVAPNLTERRALYDDVGLAALLHEGRTHDGHRPAGMPIHMFQYLSDGEVRDIIAWLRSIPAVTNPDLAEARLSDATRQQLLDGTYIYDDDQPDPGNQPPVTRPTETLALGRYLAMTSCTECHGRDLNGWGPEDDAPSLIVAKAYTPEQFTRLLRTGINSAGKPSKTGMMSGVARRRFASLTDQEISALKLYLDSH